jgi:hypothetical protein
MASCGRIGFDSGTGDDPPADIDLDLSSCTIPSPLVLIRATEGTYFDASNVLRTALPNQPRCAYDRDTGEPRGVLVEPASANYFVVSRGDGVDFENLPLDWHAEHDVGVTANAVVTDSQTFLGYREVTITTTNSSSTGQYYQIRIDIDVPSGGDYTLSFYATSDDPSGIEDWGTFGSYWTPNFLMGLGAAPSEAFTEIPGAAWTRFSRTFAAPAGAGIIQAWLGCSVRGSSGYVLTLVAPQVEPGGYPTSPIVTTGSAATRATDQITAAPQDVLLDRDAGTIVVDVTLPSGAPDPRTVLAVGDGTPLHRVAYEAPGWTASRSGATITMPGSPGGSHRIGHRYGPQGSALAVDAALAPGAATAPVTAGTAVFGSALDTSEGLSGSISRIRSWSSALDDTLLLRATN